MDVINICIPSQKKAKLLTMARQSGRGMSEIVRDAIDRIPVVLLPEKICAGKISNRTVRQIRQDRAKGMSYRALAAKYGYGLRTVNRACLGRGCYGRVNDRIYKGRSAKLTEGLILEIAELLPKMTKTKIAEELRISRTLLYKAIKELEKLDNEYDSIAKKST